MCGGPLPPAQTYPMAIMIFLKDTKGVDISTQSNVAIEKT